MRILIVDSDQRSRAALVKRLSEACRVAGLRRVELLEENLTTLGLHAAGGPPELAFLGPSCYQDLNEALFRVRSVYPAAKQAVILENQIYASQAVEIAKNVDRRIIALADLAQMTQLIAEVASSGSKKGQSSTNSDSSGSVVLFTQLKGGVGTTSVCQGIASSWANSGLSVVVVDLDDFNPQLTEWSAVPKDKRRAVGDLLRQGVSSAAQLQDCILSPEQSGLPFAVCGLPELYAESFQLKADVMAGAPSSANYIDALFDLLQENYDLVAVDAGRSWGVAAFAALRRASSVALVLDQDRTTLARSLQLLQRLWRESEDVEEFNFSKWKIIFNGYADGGLTASEVQNAFAQNRLFESTPEIYKNVYQVPFSQTAHNWMVEEGGFYQLGEEQLRQALNAAAAIFFNFKSAATAGGNGQNSSILQSLRTLIGL